MQVMPGTEMVFPGIKNEKEITDLWAYLKQFKRRRLDQEVMRAANVFRKREEIES